MATATRLTCGRTTDSQDRTADSHDEFTKFILPSRNRRLSVSVGEALVRPDSDRCKKNKKA